MINSRDELPPEALVLVHALEKLRARDGLKPARLENDPEAAPLLGLTSVRRSADVHSIDLGHAAVAVVIDCVNETFRDTQLIVIDAVLALGMFAADYERGGVDLRTISVLHSGLLGRRRSALLSHWQGLHQALDLGMVSPPSDRILRGSMEPELLRELAQQLIRRERFSFGSKSVVPATTESRLSEGSKANGTSSGRVIVIGGAVMDAIWRATDLPARGASLEAFNFVLRPGGKGLQQAVAVARLGLDVSLVAAVPDDQYGEEIVGHLRAHDVDTSLLKRVKGARTPFTCVIEFELGDSAAFNWRNQREVRLDPFDLNEIGEYFTDYHVALLTFEIPRETLEYTLTLINELSDQRPVVIVTPGQPYSRPVSRQTPGHIDYLVAHSWELGHLLPPSQDRFDVDRAARQLLTYGTGTLCVLGPACNIYSGDLGTFTVPTFTATYLDTSTSRDAFCAGLAAKLIEHNGKFDEDVALWAAAAMTAASADYPLPNPLPDRQRVDQLLERTRFKLTPRDPLVNDGDDAEPPAERPQYPR